MLSRLSSLTLAFSVSMIAVGCATEATEPSRPDNAPRGALGKADLIGTCDDGETSFCGGKSEGTCWCDEACVDFGDCCDDVNEACGIGPEPQPQTCGGFLGTPCPEGLECVDAPDDGCDPEMGGADCIGICVEEEPPPFCGGIANLPCPEGLVCVDDPNDSCDPEGGGADCGGICVEDPAECAPVLCEMFCPFGFAEGDDGCPICSCAEQPEQSACTDVGGICEVGLVTQCPDGFEPSALGCGPTLIETTCCEPVNEPAPDSCEGLCGTQAESCWCDDLCSFYGDCCDDIAQWCA